MKNLPDSSRLAILMALVLCVCTEANGATTTNATTPTAPAPVALTPTTHIRKLRAIDADNRNVLLNRTGVITVVVGTSEDSQDAAREAGKAMYPFQGRDDFQLIVVVDLRGSIATWVPSVVTGRMRSSLDAEAIELKPYFLKNGNKGNPRNSSYVIPDFKGNVCPQLGWQEGSDKLRVIIFGVEGREIDRLDNIDDMAVVQDHVRAAIQAQVDIEQAKITAASKVPGSKLLHPVVQHPPLVSYTPYVKKTD